MQVCIMAKWKLFRQSFGDVRRLESYELFEGDEITIGRSPNNTIRVDSIVISRNHCLINVKEDEVLITDLKSSNGIYVGLKRIPANVPFTLTDADLIGLGWTNGAPLAQINNTEKYVFKLQKCTSTFSRIQFQDDIKEEIVSLDSQDSTSNNTVVDLYEPRTKPQLKRKLIADRKEDNVANIDIVDLMSDTDNEENPLEQDVAQKKIKLEHNQQNIKCVNDIQYEVFNVKQEYLGFDDEPIEIDSDSESDHWYLRLSQSSPGKPFIKVEPKDQKVDTKSDDNSYSQLDDILFDNIENNEDEEILDDLISIPLEPPKSYTREKNDDELFERPSLNIENLDKGGVDKSSSDITLENNEKVVAPVTSTSEVETNIDTAQESDISCPVDGIKPNSNKLSKEANKNIQNVTIQHEIDVIKKTQMIEPLNKTLRRSSRLTSPSHKPKAKSKSSRKSSKCKNNSSTSKNKITNSQKEERKKKLKEIACKDKDVEEKMYKDSINNINKPLVNVKVTSSNRGAFLTNVITVIPMKRQTSPLKEKEPNVTSPKGDSKMKSTTNSDKNDKVNKYKLKELINTENKSKVRHETGSHKSTKIIDAEDKTPAGKTKALSHDDKLYFGKPVSKVDPLPPKPPKKSVRFSDAPPEVREFEIEPGNRLKKTSSVKTTLVDSQRMPIYSLEKISLMKILRWNPQWLNEQITIKIPPPILGHNNVPVAKFHAYKNHKQYVGLIGDLLLMEIWECLTQAYMRIRNQKNGMQLRIESLPPIPAQDKFFEIQNINVNISLPTTDIKQLPRIGELMTVEFGTDKSSRFFFVHNLRQLPSPPNNKNSFYTLSLYTTFTDKMKSLNTGEIMIGRSLAYIKKELMLFEAMEYLAESPLSKPILRPDPHYYPNVKLDSRINTISQWTATLNPTQLLAVYNSVSIALGDKPSIQMVQGPPGTGKSSVICAIIMTYFYNYEGKKQQNRGKLLVCATSNAAVDWLVIKLLNIRQKLPKDERFRMVRVGRLEAMHERARDVSSLQLAQRDAARSHLDTAPPGLAEEIAHLEAKVNMWRTAARDAQERERSAYCEGRAKEFQNKLNLLHSCSGSNGGNGSGSAERLLNAERRIIECADIIVTTLGSAYNNKMRGLKGRIALCIVDEAGQAIEPETLIPLTLGVTRLTLVGDPQQLPGYICSQRAKNHGLGESLFSRLSSCAEDWEDRNPVVLLDQQYRMHPEIADYPNRAFYNGVIKSMKQRPVEISLRPYTVLAISSGDKGQGLSGANEMEAWGVARVSAAVAQLLRGRSLSLAVITPYSAQRDSLRNNLRELQDPSDSPVEVNTVDSFQGQERDVVVVSLARSHGVGFLTDAGRMNVMLTRAKHALIVCLNPLAFSKNNQWQTLINDARKRNVFRNLPYSMCQRSASFSCEQVLEYI